MTPIPGTSRAQTIFLRSFRTSSTGPAASDWPSPAILRRWLRRPGFRSALNTVRDALRFQADFQLSAAATHAVKHLATDTAPTAIDVNRLLRISHLRQRFATDHPLAETPGADNHDKSKTDEEVPENLQCPLCARRAPDPLWIGDEEIFKHAAFKEGYTAPLREWSDFPPPVPQDTFYYQLIQTPDALLRYMLLYDQTFKDHRFQPILLSCKTLTYNMDPSEHPKFAGG